MKNAMILFIMISSCLTSTQAQNQTSETPKDEVIVKKITIQNIDGKETRTETVDTFNAASWKEESLKDEDFDIIIQDGNELKMAKELGDDAVIINPEEFQMHWNEAKAEEEMAVMPPNKAVLGVQLRSVDGDNGAQIIEVIEGSAAEKAGLQEGDILLSVDGKETNNVEEVIESLSDNKPGDKVKVTYLRGTKVKDIKTTLQERKVEKMSMKKCEPSCIAKMKSCKPEDMEKCLKNNKHLNEKVREQIRMELQDIEKIDRDGKKKMIIINKKPGEVKIIRNKGTGSNEMEIINGSANSQQLVNSKNKQSLNVEYLTSSPNPSNGQMKIQFAGPAEPTIIKVLDLNGKEVYNEKIDDFEGAYNKEIDIQNEAKGTLILKIIQGDKIITQKIIVE